MTVSSPHKLNDLRHIVPNTGKPVLLYREGRHAVYLIGLEDNSLFHSNTYLIQDGDQGVLLDPGGKFFFEETQKKISELMPTNQLTGLVLSHQDPDVASAMENWLDLKPDLLIFATPRTHILLQYYWHGRYRIFDVEKENRFHFDSGKELLFIPAPFLHFAGAVTTLDLASAYLFSGDIWAALETEQRIVVDNFTLHTCKMDLFHKDYMPCNTATKAYADSLKGRTIHGILPQHGSIIPGKFLDLALEYLKNLECGLDLIYPRGELFSIDECELQNIEELLATEKPAPEKPLLQGKEADDLDGSISPATLLEALHQAARQAEIKDRALDLLKVTEFCLKKSERLLKEAQSIGHLGHWEWDIRTGEVRWSDELYRILGYEVKELQPTYAIFMERIHPDDRKMVLDAIESAKNNAGSLYTVTHRVIRPNGDIRAVYERGQINRDPTGNAVFMLCIVQDITDFSTATRTLTDTNRLTHTIQQMQTRFITNSDDTTMYDQLLEDVLRITESKYGYIGEVLVNPDGKPYLLTQTITDLTWDKETRERYEKMQENGIEFHDLDNLFGVAITSREPVISNDPNHDPRSKGLPHGHPKIQSFLALPVKYGNQIVGIFSLANSKNGYSQDNIAFLAPLITALAQIIVARQDQKARRATEKMLEEEAKLDGLLGIPNRRYFNEYIELQIKNAFRERTPLSLIMIDVDFFKDFNDFYGHQKGDQCLVKLAEVMQGSLHRSMDIVARYGGEEFCCILPNTSENGALHVAHKITAGLAEQKIPHVTSKISDVVTVSMGIVTWKPKSHISPDDLVAAADKALYEAKQTGRNRIVVYRE